jgi:ATP-dependent exoDNAse (exonuclease V) alpha subunit
VAIYHLSAKIVKRSDGRSATAAAAYRAGVTIADRRTGLVFDYTRRRGVAHAEIIAPPRAHATFRERASLWNTVEAAERRRDAQLAREIELALPFELTPDQRLDLVREFTLLEFVARGMIADLAVHGPDRDGDRRNHHAHVMLTLRSLDDESVGPDFGSKVRAWNDTALLEHWRRAWADAVNHALAEHGHPVRVDHRSYADQGVSLEPEPKIGPVATIIERRGRHSRVGDARRGVRTRNRKRRAARTALEEINRTLDMISSAPTVGRTIPPSETSCSSMSGITPIPLETQLAPERRSASHKSAGWTRYLFAMWTTVARALTSPFRAVAAIMTRRSRLDLNR